MGLALAPVIVFFAVQEQGMANVAMIDRFFYQGYTENGTDLMLRYGAGNYYWVRLAFILPSQACYQLFGAVGGFFALRYALVLLAIVPGYLLLRRLYGPAAGWVAVAAIVVNPVLIYAWGTDYPDSSAVSYLLAGTAFLFMPTFSARTRVSWLAAGGIAIALAAHSQAVCVPLAVVVVAVRLTCGRQDAFRRRLADAAILAGAAVTVTVVLALAAKWRYGVGNILAPTWTEYQTLRSPAQKALWHTANWRWVLRDDYLLVPPTLVAVWLVVRTRRSPTRRHVTAWRRVLATAERMSVPDSLAVVCAVQLAVFTVWQFWLSGSGLEYHFYSSLLWPATVLVLATALAELSRRAGRRRWWAVPSVVLVVAVPYLLTFARGAMYTMAVGIPIAVTVIAVTAAVTLWASAATALPQSVSAALAAIVVLVGTGSLTIAKPIHDPLLPGQRPFPQAAYGLSLRSPSWRSTLDTYELADRFNVRMPKATHTGQDMLFWYRQGDDTSRALSGQYLWHINGLHDDLPTLSHYDLTVLQARRGAELTLIAFDPARLAQAVVSIRATGIQLAVLDRFTVTAGPLRRSVTIVRLDHIPAG